ncbi:MAG: trypsin-like peptidase domain-containing protein [Dehalococcoidia bacterium]|nr:trypsin-like peptidase domain-containing protein [Dehalococcoidia bacterium]MDD5494321.1 trypsin-like peptidase domain-containing protein [Dehalococcoidia bacterium]
MRKTIVVIILFAVILPASAIVNFSGCGDPQQAAFEGVGKAVVRIYCNNAMGNGVVIDEKGLVLTNTHVIVNCKNIKVKLGTGQEYDGKVVCRSTNTDIAVIEIDADPGIAKAVLGDSDNALPGSPVAIVGYSQKLMEKPVVLKGLVAAAGLINGVNYVETDMVINTESSGSPVVNTAGEVIGIIGWEHGAAEGAGAAVATNQAKALLTSMKEAQSNILLITETTPPIIYSDYAIFSWKTNRPSTSQVEYGLTQTYGTFTTLDVKLMDKHTVVVNSLKPSTKYYFKLRSQDVCGGEIISAGDSEFLTKPPQAAPLPAPQIVDFSILDLSSSDVTVRCITDQPTTLQIQYGTDKADKPFNKSDTKLAVEHSMRLEKLQLDTTYYIDFTMTNSQGKTSHQLNLPFITPPLAPSCSGMGCEAPSFNLKTLDNLPFTSNDIIGKKAVITFTSITCSICAGQVKYFNEVYKDPKYKDVIMMTVASGDKKEDILRWMKLYGVQTPVYQDESSDMVNAFKPPMKPSAYFIDPGGIIKYVKKGPIIGTGELKDILDSY